MAELKTCARCRRKVDLHDAYVVGFAKKGAMEWIYLCPSCEVDLRDWIFTSQPA